jgi:molybdopterin molybdotransferase
VRLEDGAAHPIRGKSGLVAGLAGVDGYICVARDCEGLAKGAEVRVVYF